jgi:predicted nucleotidyltransferase
MHRERQAELEQALQHILRVLTTQYQPEKVILFGSMASGEIHEWSDLDLVIIKETTTPFLQRLKEVALLCLSRVGVDYLVYTPNELTEMIAERNHFILTEVLKKGKVLYER